MTAASSSSVHGFPLTTSLGDFLSLWLWEFSFGDLPDDAPEEPDPDGRDEEEEVAFEAAVAAPAAALARFLRTSFGLEAIFDETTTADDDDDEDDDEDDDDDDDDDDEEDDEDDFFLFVTPSISSR